MMRLIEVFDRQRKRVAVMQNAYNVREKHVLNGVGELTFSLPEGDEKAKYLQPRRYVRYDGGEMYRILEMQVDDDGAPVISVTCEHAIASLADRVLYKDHVRSGFSTRENIEYILSFQEEWVLGECDFDFSYDYGWTSENLLAALFSIATPFVAQHRWIFDTSGATWKIHLKTIDGATGYAVFAGLNFLRSRKSVLSGEVVTRLYLQGFGEGINQLDVSAINGGLPYIQASDEQIEKYGLIERVYTDRAQKEPASLLAIGQSLLAQGQEPREEYEIEAADLRELGVADVYRAQVGETMLFAPDQYRTIITEIEWNHDVAGDMRLTIANTPEDLADGLADLADRQRIEQTYAQGATQIWGSVMADNADESHPLKYPLWIPNGLTIMNYVQLRIELERFRGYTRGVASGGGSVTTTTSGGGSTSSASGGATYTSTSGGATTVSTPRTTWTAEAQYTGTGRSPTGSGVDNITDAATVLSVGSNHSHVYEHRHSYFPSITIPPMEIDIPPHRHSVSVGNHTHTVPAHSHGMTIPSHTHETEYGIYQASEQPTSATVRINGQDAFSMGTEWEGDISQYLINSDGKFPRGRFVNIEVRPNTIARITVAAAPQGFIESKGGGRY